VTKVVSDTPVHAAAMKHRTAGRYMSGHGFVYMTAYLSSMSHAKSSQKNSIFGPKGPKMAEFSTFWRAEPAKKSKIEPTNMCVIY
jgi:hypothetical protein